MKEKLDYMEKQFKLELDREESLNKKAQFYLSIISIVLSILIFNAKDLKELLENVSSCWPIIFFALSIIFIFISIVYITISMKIHNYERPTKMDTIKVEMIKEITDINFQMNRIADIII